jgi:hypothetical protein
MIADTETLAEARICALFGIKWERIRSRKFQQDGSGALLGPCATIRFGLDRGMG